MSNPQQPELRRSGHTPAEQDHASEIAGGTPRTRERRRAAPGPVPSANEPGHHPEREQDKPADPAHPPTPSPTAPAPRDERSDRPRLQRFPFEFDSRFVPLALPFGVVPATAYAEVDDAELRVRFGPWSLSTPLDNIAETTPTGPYQWWKVVGPPRVSMVDRGITFATTASGGLCIRFREPVPAVLPTSTFRHPAATVTVATPTALAEALPAAARP